MAMACSTERRLTYSSTTPTTTKWADELPHDLLGLIVKKLASNVVDIIRFEAVCSSWNRAARLYTSTPYYTLLPQYPWLMLLILPITIPDKWSWCPKPPRIDHESRCFISLAENKVYKMDWKASQDFHGYGECLGSSHGWLAIREFKTMILSQEIIHLFNPISRQRLTLPLRPGKASTAKVVLSSDPSCNNNFVVVVIYDISLGPPGIAFYQHGRGGGNAAAWTDLEGSHDHYSDIVFHNNGQLFALSTNHSIQVWDFGDTYNNYPTKIMDFQPSMNRNVLDGPMTHHKKWLVESMGEILFVERQWLWLGSDTKGAVDFYVCKLNIAAKKWEKVECLRGCALFLVRNQSAMSLSTRELPKLEENSIYYAETYQEGDLYKRKLHRGWSEIRVGKVFKFNLETKVVKPYYITREHVDTSYSKPVWIVPSP
ncbi:unnamed protein product [Prunus brigantina]